VKHVVASVLLPVQTMSPVAGGKPGLAWLSNDGDSSFTMFSTCMKSGNESWQGTSIQLLGAQQCLLLVRSSNACIAIEAWL
jgi:hypothetical protein